MFKIGEFAQIAQVSTRQLRHYDQIGLLRPDRTDAATGYRYYSIRQLRRLNAILALKELGFTLEQVRPLINNEVPAQELRGMLALKRAEAARALAEEEARLRHIASRIEELEATGGLGDYDVVMKSVPALPFLSVSVACEGMDEALRLLADVAREGTRQIRASLRDRLMVVARNDFESDRLDLEAGFSLTRPSNAVVRLAGGLELRYGELPAVETMATLVRSGPGYESHRAFGALGAFMEAQGYVVDGPCREVFLEPVIGDPGLADALVEIQFPVRHAA